MMKKTVWSRGGLLSLYTQKFNLSELAKRDEKIVLKVVLRPASGGRIETVFVNYVGGRKEAQIVTHGLSELGEAIVVSSVERYELDDMIEDATKIVGKATRNQIELVERDRRIFLKSENKEVPVVFRGLYASGGKAYATLECRGKLMKVSVGDGQLDLYDGQRRRVAGVSISDGGMVLQRAFQHRDE